MHARLKGRFIVSFLIGKRRFVKPFRLGFVPIKPKRGALRSRDSVKVIWVYNKRTRTYRVRDRTRSSCEGRGRMIRGGSIVTITEVLKVRRTDIVKARRFVKRMVGTWTLVQKPTAKGRRAGCGAFRAKGRVIMVRKGRVSV